MYFLWTLAYFTLAGNYIYAKVLRINSATDDYRTKVQIINSTTYNYEAIISTNNPRTNNYETIVPTAHAITTNITGKMVATSKQSTAYITRANKSSAVRSREIMFNKWVSSPGQRIFYLVRNAKLEMSACLTFCKYVDKGSTLGVFGESIASWIEDNYIIPSGEKYWVQEQGATTGCHYLSASNYPRGVYCPKMFGDQDTCKSSTLYKRSVLKSTTCLEKLGCICQIQI